ncbi:MAG TPA: immunoglobulin domain-containing protein [Geothrix sp.]
MAPAISVQPANQTVLEGATASFTVTAAGTAPLTYQWKKGGTAITGATSASYTTPATVLADTGSSFTVTVSNAAGSVTSNAATLTVNPAPPTITTQPANVTVTAGATATFTVAATGSGTLSYQWKKGGTAITGATSASYTTPATVLADNGASFTVTVTNAQGTATSNAAVLTVQAAPVFTTQPVGATVTAGAAVTFTAAASGNPAPTFQWFKGTTLLTGQTAATLTIPSATLADAGSYTVVATNTLGTATSTAAVLIVNQAPVFTTQPLSQTVIAPASVTFTAAASGFPAPTYQWQKGGVAIAGATSATFTITTTSLADAATYTCVATNSIGTTTSNGAVLTIQVPPAITTQPVGTTVTAPASASFTVVATGTPAPTYQWQKSGVNIAGATSATYTIASTTLADAGAYTVVVTNAAGSVTSTAAALTVNAAPVITTQPANQSVVVGQTATFSVTATGNPTPTYQWRKGGVALAGATGSSYTTPITVIGDSGSTFDVVVTNAIGTATSAIATLTVNPAPVAPGITTQPASLTVAAGASATFSVVATGTPTPTYQWQKGGVAIAGATGSSYTIPAVVSTDAGVYTVVATNTAGTITSSGATLDVLYKPVITVQPISQTVGQGTTVTFSVAANGNPAPTYQWQKGGVNIASATSSSYTIPAVASTDAGTYTVVVTNSQGSVTSTAATLTVTLNYSVSGRVTLTNGGAGVSGVTLSINTTPATTAVTDGTGNFTLGNIPNGAYTVTPSITGPSALFFPATQPVTVASANVTNVQFQAALGYTVSGTVSYAGIKTGRVFLRLDGGNGGGAPGVSVSPAGTFTIRGVASGTYTLKAWMDTVGQGVPNASNPTGSVSVVVGNSNYAGANVTLADPAAVSLTGVAGPLINGVVPMDGGAFTSWDPMQNAQFVETPDSYLLQWSTSSTFATLAGSATIPAAGKNNPMYLHSGLTNGTAYYFRMYGKAGATTSNPSATAGPITPGPATGGFTVSGTVTFTGTATGPLYVGLYDQAAGRPYAVRIANPVSPQAFSVPGVPAGTFFFFGILDQNNNGLVDLGDMSNINGKDSSLITVSGSMTGQSLTIPSTNVTASVATSHQKYTSGAITNESYSLNFNVDQNIKRPVNVTIQMGSALLDVGKPDGTGYYYWVNTATLRPTVGDAYTLQLGYSDGTSETRTVTVSAILDTFPLNLAPVTGAAAGTTPTFTWAAPSPAPSFPYTYSLWIQQLGGGQIWQYPSNGDMPSTQLSVLYNVDGKASQPALTTGITYGWSISLMDVKGNSAQQMVEYKP